jgi:hypothetical protein
MLAGTETLGDNGNSGKVETETHSANGRENRLSLFLHIYEQGVSTHNIRPIRKLYSWAQRGHRKEGRGLLQLFV